MAYFNEKDYLFYGNKEDIDKLDEYKSEMKETRRKELIEYDELIYKYNVFIRTIASFLKNLDLDTSLEYSLAIRYMIINGIVSYNNTFINDKFEFEKELCLDCGINIVSGEGCCRNVTDFHKDIMAELEFFCKKFYCYQSALRLRKGAFKMKANHVANLIIYDGYIYVMDLYNNTLCKFISNHEAKSISFEKKLYLAYKPYYEYILDDSKISDIKTSMELFESLSKIPALNEYTWSQDLRPEIISKISGMAPLFKEFGRSTKEMQNDIKLCLTK